MWNGSGMTVFYGSVRMEASKLLYRIGRFKSLMRGEMKEYINIFGLLMVGGGLVSLLGCIGWLTPTIAGNIVVIAIGLIAYFVSIGKDW